MSITRSLVATFWCPYLARPHIKKNHDFNRVPMLDSTWPHWGSSAWPSLKYVVATLIIQHILALPTPQFHIFWDSWLRGMLVYGVSCIFTVKSITHWSMTGLWRYYKINPFAGQNDNSCHGLSTLGNLPSFQVIYCWWILMVPGGGQNGSNSKLPDSQVRKNLGQGSIDYVLDIQCKSLSILVSYSIPTNGYIC